MADRTAGTPPREAMVARAVGSAASTATVPHACSCRRAEEEWRRMVVRMACTLGSWKWVGVERPWKVAVHGGCWSVTDVGGCAAAERGGGDLVA